MGKLFERKLFERLGELRDLINEAEKESSMKPYWMVHRYGRQSGVPQKVHTSFESAYKEAERLTRKERDRFVILQAHTMIEPYEPLVIQVETIGDPPAYPDSPDEKVSECTLPGCTCKNDIATPIPTFPNCPCQACTTGVVTDPNDPRA